MDKTRTDFILISQKNVKDIRISVKAEYFGSEWLSANPRHPPRYMGTIRGWKHKGNRELYILWEGNSRCTAVHLSQLMGLDDDGASVECQLHDYEDGLPAPTYVEPAAVAPPSRRARGQAAAEVATGDGDAADDEDPVLLEEGVDD